MTLNGQPVQRLLFAEARFESEGFRRPVRRPR